MNSDGKIYITISDKRGRTGGGSIGNDDGGSIVNNSSKDKARKYSDMQMFSFIKGQAMQSVNMAIGNIGNFTGNYQLQRDIQAGMSAISTIANIGNAFAVGGVAGGVIAITGVGLNIAQQDFTGFVANKQQNKQIDILRQTSGMNALIDGSRGTEN